MKEAKQETEMITGTIDKYSSNKHDDVDGLTLSVKDKKTEIKFPPHTAKYILAVAERGDEVELSYEEKEGHGDKPHPPQNHLLEIKNKKTSKIFEVESVHPPKPPVEKDIVDLDVKQYELRKGKKGEVVGIVFKQDFIHIDPKLADGITNKIEAGVSLAVKAQKRLEVSGFVNIHQYQVYHAKTVAVN